jgi:signal transduction histidine kinase
MNALSLRIKLLVIVLVPILLLVMTSIIGIANANTTTAALATVTEDSLPFVTLVEEIKFNGSRLISSTNELLLDTALELEEADEEGEEGESGEIQEIVTLFNGQLQRYMGIVNEDHIDNIELHSTVTATAQTILDLADTIAFGGLALETEAMTELREEFEEAEEAFLAAIDTVLVNEQTELAENNAIVNQTVANANLLIIGLAVLATAIASVLGYLVYRAITRPVDNLQAAAHKLSAGDLTQRAVVESSDEIGDLAVSFNSMAATIEQRVTETEAARARAERSDQVKSAFLASMSHELRTPLNSVINFTQFVVDGDVGEVNEQQTELLREVVGSGKHLLNLINDVLDMSKIEAGSLQLFVERDVNVEALLQKAVMTTRSLVAGKPVRVHTDIAPNLAPITADRQRVLQILLNIVSNAVKFTDEGEITLSAKQSGEDVVIAIQDTGIGIAPEDRVMVFEPFKQTESGLRQAGGTGLGLPIARSLAEAHGGRLWFDSVPGKGSTFYVSLPIKTGILVPTMG